MTRKFRFIKDYECKFGKILRNTEVQYMNNAVYINGGLLSPDNAKIIDNIISNDVDGEYTRVEEPVVGEF